MIQDSFERILKNRIFEMERVLGIKAKEYTRNADRLSNFKRAAAMLQTIPEKALMGMLSKHLVSIMDMVDDLEAGISHQEIVWNEKLGDAINYFVLLEALLYERGFKKVHLTNQTM